MRLHSGSHSLRKIDCPGICPLLQCGFGSDASADFVLQWPGAQFAKLECKRDRPISFHIELSAIRLQRSTCELRPPTTNVACFGVTSDMQNCARRCKKTEFHKDVFRMLWQSGHFVITRGLGWYTATKSCAAKRTETDCRNREQQPPCPNSRWFRKALHAVPFPCH